MANIVVVIVTNPMFILPWVHEKFAVKFTMSNVDGCGIYMHNCPEPVNSKSEYVPGHFYYTLSDHASFTTRIIMNMNCVKPCVGHRKCLP